MTIQKRSKDICIFCTMLLLIVSNSKFLANLGLGSYFEYGAYFLLLCGVAVCFLAAKKPARSISQKLIVFALISFLFSIGIAVQDLSVLVRLRLIATMLAIAGVAVLAEDYLCSLHCIRIAAYGIFAGTLVTTLLSLIAGVPVLEYVYEGLLPYGFTGGVLYKNFYAAFLLASFMGLFFYNRYVRKVLLDRILMAVQIVLVLLSHARGTYVFVAAFLVLSNLPVIAGFLMRFKLCQRAVRIWQGWKKPYRILFIAAACVTALLLIASIFAVLVCVSENYAMRYRGVVKYWHYVRHDPFRVIFGNAAQIWSNPNADYVDILRDLIGEYTSFEMAFLNTFIKNGVLGLIGFVLLFAHIAFTAHKVGTREGKHMVFTIMLVLLLSSLVESFATNIHSIFGVICYLYMAGLCGMCRRERLTDG